MKHGKGANFTGNESWSRGGLWAIIKLRKLLEALAQKAEQKNIFAMKRRVGHSWPGKGWDVLNFIKGNPQLV